jgi:hypothetical protein
MSRCGDGLGVRGLGDVTCRLVRGGGSGGRHRETEVMRAVMVMAGAKGVIQEVELKVGEVVEGAMREGGVHGILAVLSLTKNYSKQLS